MKLLHVMGLLVCIGCDDAKQPAEEDCEEQEWFADDDGDGHGDASQPQSSCDQPDDHVASSDDCDPLDGAVYPDAPEACDEVDSDCDGDLEDGEDALEWLEDADGDGYGSGPVSIQCSASDGHVTQDGDCDDTDATIHPTADDYCTDTIDSDCDGSTNDGIDGSLQYTDADADGYGDPATADTVCSVAGDQVSNLDDCDDADPTAYPDALEACGDGIDSNCDGADDLTAQFSTDGVYYTSMESELSAGGVVSLSEGALHLCEGTFSVRLSSSSTLSVYGAGAGLTILDGSGEGTVVSGSTLSLSGLTIQSGDLGVSASSAVLDDVVVTENHSSTTAGVQVSGALDMVDSTVSSNSASLTYWAYSVTCSGGGVYVGGDLTMERSAIQDNTLSCAGGGSSYQWVAAYGAGASVEGSVSLTDSAINSNTLTLSGNGYYLTAFGAGLYTTGTVLLDASTIDNNTIDVAHYFGTGGGTGDIMGGGVYTPSIMTLIDASVSGNDMTYSVNAYSASGTPIYPVYISGSGIYASDVIMEDSWISANTYSSTNSGMLLYEWPTGIYADDVDCTASKKGAGGITDNAGPGVYVSSTTGSVSSTDCDWGSVGIDDNTGGDVTGTFSHDVDGIGSFTCASGSCL